LTWLDPAIHAVVQSEASVVCKRRDVDARIKSTAVRFRFSGLSARR
jgi:hypothetical protein